VLVIVYQDDGRVKEAIPLLERVVVVREITLAETHPYRLASQHMLGVALSVPCLDKAKRTNL
ncbi:hypothetical protein B0T11DRAFT_227391, partial [Plectosphaerella cucumerina]